MPRQTLWINHMMRFITQDKDINAIEIHDKSDFFTAIVKASRLLAGNDNEQAGHLIYISDGRLIMNDLQERIQFLESCLAGSIHFVTLQDNEETRNELIEQIVAKVKTAGKQASCLAYHTDTAEPGPFARSFFADEFSPLRTILKFGHMEGALCIHPRPPGIQSGCGSIKILGVVKVSELEGPPLESRHLVQAEKAESLDEPHLVVLLLESLLLSDEEGPDKGKKSAAIVKVGNRYGILKPQEDQVGTKLRHWLAFWLIPPGDDPLPWYGPLQSLGYKDSKNMVPFPVCDEFARKRSYSTPTIAWTKDKSVTSDVTKLMRAARKLPDKAPHFYKELNKIRRACLSYGFFGLLDGIVQCLEFEQKVLAETKPQAVEAIQKATDLLRSSRDKPFDYIIQ